MNDNNHVEQQLLDSNLLVALKRFQRNNNDNDENGLLWMHNVYFNRATLHRLVAFLTTTTTGHNNNGHSGHCTVVQQLNLSTCRFDNVQTFQLFCNFLSNNSFPRTLEMLHLERCLHTERQERLLLASFHTNTTIKILSLHGGNSSSIQGAAGGSIMSALLLSQNSTLTTINLSWSFDDVAFIRALKEGILLAAAAKNNTTGSAMTTCHLQSLALLRMIPNETTLFDKLQLVFVKKNPGPVDATTSTVNTTTTTTTTTTTCLNLCHSFDPNAMSTLKQLRPLLLTMPGLNDLNVTDNWLKIAPHALMQGTMRQQLQKLNLSNCNINHIILNQMTLAASIVVVPGNNHVVDNNVNNDSSCTAALVELNLSRNKIHGHRGGTSLGCFLLLDSKLQTLILSGNKTLGAIGIRALAPTLSQHCKCLSRLNLSSCRIQDGGITILKIFTATTTNTTTTSCLTSLDLSDNILPPATLAAVAEYLNHSSSHHLQELYLSENKNLFKSFNSSNNDQGSYFFDALANHKTMKKLHVCNVGMNEQQTKRPLLLALLQNTTLLQVHHSMTTTGVQCVTTEYMRRNHLHANMKSTMDQPISIPCALWPVVLEVCSPSSSRQQSSSTLMIGPTIVFCLVQKMMESNVFL